MGSSAPQAAPVVPYLTDALGLTDTGVASSSAGQAASRVLGLGVQGPSLNDQLGQLPGPKKETERGEVVSKELEAEKQRARRRAASQTLFTGGRGVLERPSTASSVLLGY